MNIFICDDNPIIQNQLHDLLNKYFKKHSYPSPEYFIFDSGDALVRSDVIPDIVFLDMEMPGINGIAVGNTLHNRYKKVIIIVVTAYSEYLDDAMRFNVFRYLSKPINRHRLDRNLDDALNQIESRASNFVIDDNSALYSISTDDIVMIETHSNKRKTIIHTISRDYESVNNMQHWCKQLHDNNCFYQCNRSYIINMRYVTSFENDMIQLCKGQFSAYITKRKSYEFRKLYLMYVEHSN